MSEAAVALKEPAVILTKEDIRRYICPEATDKEVFMFLGVCKSFGLNPLKREVHLIKYGHAPASIVTGYEVYLKRAERTGKLNGWKVEVAKDGQAATVTIHRKDWNQPFEWTAYRQEFDKGQANWKTMPLFMLRKVAMAQAFRICFPDEMGGLPYLPEEVVGTTSEALPSGNVDTTTEPAVVPPQVPPAAPGERVKASNDAPPAPTPPPTGDTKHNDLINKYLTKIDQLVEKKLFGDITDAKKWATEYDVKKGPKAGTKGHHLNHFKMESWQLERAIAKIDEMLMEDAQTQEAEIPDEDIPY